MLKNAKGSPRRANAVQLFGFFRYFRREYFDTLNSFCSFLALDMAPTRAGPGLFLVGAFLVKRARLLQRLVFFLFRQTTDLIVYHFLQKLLKLLRPSPANANLVQRVPLSFLLFLT